MNNTAPPARTGRGKYYAALVALAGALFSAAAGLGGADSLCLTQGCSLYKDVALLGVSLWWWGAAAFALMAGLCFAGLLRFSYGVAIFALVVDCVLLAWMAVSVPCINCLVAGGIFFALFVSLAVILRARALPAVAVAAVWLVLFSPNIFAVGQELAGPWSIRGSADAPVRVFFSPSCPSCKQALKGLLKGGEDNLGFYPVAENEDDVKRLAGLREHLEAGKPFAVAFAASRDPLAAPELGFWDELSLRLGLMRNKVALARMGAPRIPVIVMYGVPSGFGANRPLRDQAPASAPMGLDFGGGGEFSGCTQLGEGVADCDEPATTQDIFTPQSP